MSGHLFLSLPLTTGWTTSNCLVTEGSWLPMVFCFSLIPLDSSLPLLAECSSVTNRPPVLEVVPHCGGALSCGSISFCLWMPSPTYLGSRSWGWTCMTASSCQEFSGAWGSCSCSFSLATTWITTSYPLMLDNWSSLWCLVSSSPCLDGNLDVWLPLSLWWLATKYSCLQNVGGLADIFPDLVFGPWTCWTCHSTTGWRWPVLGPFRASSWELCVWTTQSWR